MKTKWLINPFERIAGWQALGIGVCVMALTAVFGKINNIAFDGVLDVHAGPHGFTAAFAMQAVNLIVLFLIMWPAGVCFSKSKIRAVDVAGTIALSRTPMLLLTTLCFLPIVPSGLSDITITRIVVFSIISIILIIWMIALMYQGYSLSCGIKGSRSVISFIGALLIAELVSKCVFIFLLGSLFTNIEVAKNNDSPANPIESTVTVDLSDIHQSAEKIVAAFGKSDFEAIVAYFDDTMKKGLSAGKLKLTWLQITMTNGAFENADLINAKKSSIEKFDIIDIPLTFKKSQLNLRLTFNKDGTIGGLFLLPVN